MLVSPNKDETELSKAATARVIWLCASVRYCKPRGWWLTCVPSFFCLLICFSLFYPSENKRRYKLSDVAQVCSEQLSAETIHWLLLNI